MTWSVGLLILLSLAAIAGGLTVLLRTAKPLPLTDEQLKKIKEREVEQERKDAQDR
ncbi:DUF2897 family protein [Ectopseudomonas mendocina]|uniref:DUF2897 family protein n=1 Tax=Ectopseudomonas mendocina TaxID=300 RepID=A0ABZ2RBI5_ECTME